MGRVPTDTFWGLTDPVMLEMRGNQRWHYFRRRLYERDAGRCGLCGDPVAMTDMDMDHIIPKRRGGPTHWDNLRTTHKLCNRKRGGREGNYARKTGSRGWYKDRIIGAPRPVVDYGPPPA